ncbi:MAG: hypothetical protein V1891_00675 [bacterium]
MKLHKGTTAFTEAIVGKAIIISIIIIEAIISPIFLLFPKTPKNIN